jgi:hypothetical protein
MQLHIPTGRISLGKIPWQLLYLSHPFRGNQP